MKSKKSLGLPRGTHRAKWGQNFLRDKRILKKIADFAQIEKEDTVVEVGSGEGTLTSFLLEKAKKVIAIEKDSDLALLLREKFKEEIKVGKLEVVEGDILDLEIQNIFSPQAQKCTDIFLLKNSSCSAQSASQGISKLADSKYFGKQYKLVGNIPYYITGALFKKALEAENPPKSITFVVQKEVAERILAKDGKESILSISIKVYGKPEFGGIIKAGSFYPKPKVDSAIISVRDISKKHFINAVEKRSSSLSTDIFLLKNSSARSVELRKARSEDFFQLQQFEQKFFEILKKGFAHKRKFLIKNLAEVSKVAFENCPEKATFDTSNLKEIFEKCEISEKTRAENLRVKDWVAIARELT